jgi:hypothetical protein
VTLCAVSLVSVNTNCKRVLCVDYLLACSFACSSADNSANSARVQTFKGARFPAGVNFVVTNSFGAKTKNVMVRQGLAACTLPVRGLVQLASRRAQLPCNHRT